MYLSSYRGKTSARCAIETEASVMLLITNMRSALQKDTSANKAADEATFTGVRNHSCYLRALGHLPGQQWHLTGTSGTQLPAANVRTTRESVGSAPTAVKPAIPSTFKPPTLKKRAVV